MSSDDVHACSMQRSSEQVEQVGSTSKPPTVRARKSCQKHVFLSLFQSAWPHALFRRRNEPLFNIIPSSAMSKDASGDWLKAVWTSASTVFLDS